MENNKLNTSLDKRRALRNENNDGMNETTSNDSIKRKTMNNASTGIKQKLVPELISMVNKNMNYLKFLSEYGELAANRNQVITEESDLLNAIICFKQSTESQNTHESSNHDKLGSSNRVSNFNYKYYGLSFVGLFNIQI